MRLASCTSIKESVKKSIEGINEGINKGIRGKADKYKPYSQLFKEKRGESSIWGRSYEPSGLHWIMILVRILILTLATLTDHPDQR